MRRIALAGVAAAVPALFGFQYYWPQQPGYGPQPGFPAGPGFGDEPAFVRSLYLQYLRREPDPQGMQTWLERLAQFGGDRQRLAGEFIQAAQREMNSNNPAFWGRRWGW